MSKGRIIGAMLGAVLALGAAGEGKAAAIVHSAGESFDMRDEGVGARVGFRWNPRLPLEVSGYAHYSAVGEANLTTSVFEPDTTMGVGVMWYFFRDLGIGVDYSNAQEGSVAFSMRFSFGDLGLQR
jgi:hypothetical protein